MAEEKKGGDKVSQPDVKGKAENLAGNPGNKSNQDPANVSGSSLSGEGTAGVPPNKPADNAGNFNPQQPSNKTTSAPPVGGIPPQRGDGDQDAKKGTVLAARTSETEEISEEEAESRLHQELVKTYGSDFVRVHKKDSPEQKQTFSRRAWDLLGPAGKDGTKEGWKPDVKVPKEVKDLKAKKEEGEND